jgi:hypothetical protein
MDEHGLETVEVRTEVQADFNREIQAKMRGSVWTAGGCASWYLDSSGRNTTLWPGFTWRFRQRTRRFALANYLVRAPEPAPRVLATERSLT